MGTVAIIGGGTGGASCARAIHRKLGSKHQVILIEEKEEVYNQALFPLVAAGKRKRTNIARKIDRLNRRGIRVINDRAEKIDHQRKNIYTGNGKIGYDLAILAMGAALDPSLPLGMQEAGLDAQSLAGAENIFSRLQDFQGKKIAILAASTRIKCPAAPYEYAFLIENLFSRREDSGEIEIVLYTPEPSPLYRFGSRVSEAISELLLERKIYLNINCRYKGIDTESKKIVLDRGTYPFDLLIYFAGVAPPALIAESDLPNIEGWLEVDRYLRVAGQDKILGLGDATRITAPTGEVLPKMGAIAHLQSFVAAANAVRILSGKEPNRTYSGFSG